MKLHRFFVSASIIQQSSATLTDPELVNQLSRVLRFREGDRLILLDGAGLEYLSEVKKLDSKNVELAILEKKQNQNEPDLKITLYQSLIKKDHFEWVLQKCTEAGVTSFVPILSARSEKKGLNVERAKKILKEAAEQSERGVIPTLSEIVDFTKAIEQAKTSGDPTLFLHPEGQPIAEFSSQSKRLNLFVGPEGGWTDEEVQQAKEHNLSLVSLGPRILRSETAGIVASAILLN